MIKHHEMKAYTFRNLTMIIGDCSTREELVEIFEIIEISKQEATITKAEAQTLTNICEMVSEYFG